MRTSLSLRNLAVGTLLTIGALGLPAAPARAQAFGFSYASPGFSLGVGRGVYGPVYGGYPPVVAPGPVVVAPPPVVVAPPPVVVAQPVIYPRPFYGGYYYGGGYRPYYGRPYYRR